MSRDPHALLLLLTLSVGTPAVLGASGPEGAAKPELVEVRKIWDQAPHNAFTDLIRFRDRWYCVFREGQGHVSPDGTVRVITSGDGRDWSSAALIALKGADLRDPKITRTPEGRLMIVAAAARDRKPSGEARHQSMTWFSEDGRNWDEGHAVADADFWLWRVAWHEGAAYGVGYGCTSREKFVSLYRSRDGIAFDNILAHLFDPGYPNEAGLVFEDDGTLLCLLRRDESPRTGMLGSARPPYTNWTWRDLGVPIGGPQMIRLPDGRLVAAVRLYDGRVRTSLGWVDAKAATFREFLALPSGGDTSYPGLVWHEGELWVSYYSSHEGKTSIYLARVKLPTR
ncbi:MAG: exo-alpha-sialidase [Isosphaeraceae bacterium]